MCGWDDASVRDTVSRLHQPAKMSELEYTAQRTAVHPDLLEPPPEEELDYIERNRASWEQWAPARIAAGRKAWQTDELLWGLWGTPESELRLLDGFDSREDAIELGSGTAATSAWLARRGLRPVAVDFAKAQLRAAETFQREFGPRFPLVPANAEEVPFDSESFDLAISEYGASVWCSPHRWLPEVHRLLRPEGRLIFFTSSAILMTCTPADGGTVGDRLVQDYFARYRVEFEAHGSVEFHLTHGHWVRLLRATGFMIDNLIEEIKPPLSAKPSFNLVSPEWAQRWPSEEIWIAHKAS
jgi:SAM-dependent methyltransferase